MTVTKSAPSVPSWTANAPSSVASAPSSAIAVASGPITIPDLTGQNAKIAEDKLEALGLTNVELASATSKYQNVFLPANWTVVGIEPAPGTTVNAGDTVVVKVTKP
ncbi:PASTA domain-containing protein [Mycobacterium sp.]|uniref:PASTA domain-containing protein n=1 Tax=Mycobacterium sp. TaxID=1785 RepID=UPI003F9AFB07